MKAIREIEQQLCENGLQVTVKQFLPYYTMAQVITKYEGKDYQAVEFRAELGWEIAVGRALRRIARQIFVERRDIHIAMEKPDDDDTDHSSCVGKPGSLHAGVVWQHGGMPSPEKVWEPAASIGSVRALGVGDARQVLSPPRDVLIQQWRDPG